MKITFADKAVAYLALISGLSISVVAVYYSVAGLVSIFAAAALPIMVMGVVLELSKLVATVWLKVNWSIAPRLIRLYLFVAVMILMMITSMGIFGYLSKAHLDQAVPTGDVVAKVAIIDEKIKTQRDNIDAGRKALTQLDAAVDQIMGRSTDENGATKAANLRRSQAKERAALQSDIGKAQKEIATLNEERAPIASELRKVEAEVGPIKYIAALLYGDQAGTDVLEKSVRFVIILIVVIFDPLAVVLLLASQYSFQYFRRLRELEAVEQVAPLIVTPESPGAEVSVDIVPELEPEPEVKVEKSLLEQHPYLTTPFVHFTTLTPIVAPVEEIDLPEAVIEEVAQEFDNIKTEIPATDDLSLNERVGLAAAPTLSLEDSLMKIIKEGEQQGHWNSKDFELARNSDHTDNFAPPGTPGEAWATPSSEQQPKDNSDKISNDAFEKLHRNRSWFQAVFPKRDDKQ